MQTANASASIRVKKRFLVFMEILLNCSGLWYPSCIGLAAGRICSASARRCLSLGCGGVLWNNFTIPQSFHIRHVSAVFQECYVAKGLFYQKSRAARNRVQPCLKILMFAFYNPIAFMTCKSKRARANPSLSLLLLYSVNPCNKSATAHFCSAARCFVESTSAFSP